MGLIVAALVLLAVAAAKSQQQRASSGGQQPPQEPQQHAPARGSEAAGSNPVQDFVNTATKLGGIEAGVAVAYTAAGYGTGKAIGGTELAGALGATNPVWGNAAVVGSQLGKELDKALGGREEAASNQAAQGAGAILAGGFVALGPFIGPLFLVGIGELLVLAYLIVVAVEDATRLAYGQNGARADYEKEWLRMYGRGYDELAGKTFTRPDGSKWKPTDAEINRAVWPFVDGYMRKRNELAFQRWMKQPWGLGKDAQGHAIYGRDRGYFVGEVAAGTLSLGPPRKADSHEYAQFIPASEVVLVNVPRYDFYEEGIKDENPNTPWYLRAFAKESTPSVHSMYLHPWYNTNDFNGPTFDETQAKKDGYVGTRWVRKQNGTEQRYSDNRRWEIDRAGAVAGNVAEYVAWMKHPRGFGHTDASHLVYGRNEGRFDGESAGGGLLLYEGQTWNWKDVTA